MRLHNAARVIIFKAMKRHQSRSKVARFYGIAPEIVACYMSGEDCGTIHAREIIRVEIARLEAERRGEYDFFPGANDRYKGTR